jgi:ABC-type Mn2+/Zn2+ transport system ATPase subunit
MDPLIEFRNATLGYGRRAVLRDITFSVSGGEYFGLVGPNGAGKTTILRAILGSLRPVAGTVVVGGGTSPVRIGYVPQREAIDLVLPYTAEEVVMMSRYRGIGMFRRPGWADQEIVTQSLVSCGVESLRRQWFKNLSGGQKQRVLIARALAAQPNVLILDEPTNGMDLLSRTSILELIATLHRERGITVLIVSHLLDDVANHVQRIVLVDRKIIAAGTVTEVLTGENLSKLYAMHVDVKNIGGRLVILPGGHHGID